MENALDAVQKILESIVSLAQRDPATLLALGILVYAITRLFIVVDRGMRSLAKSVAASLPWQRKDTVVPPDPIIGKFIDFQNDLLSILKGTESNEKRLIDQAEKRIERDEKQEALIAALVGKSVGLEDGMRTLSAAIEALINRADKSETEEGARAGRLTAVQAINNHTSESLKPMQTAMEAIPPRLETINTTLTQLPANISTSFQTVIISERDAARLERDAAITERDALRLQLVQLQGLPALVATQDTQIKNLMAENARLSALITPAPQDAITVVATPAVETDPHPTGLPGAERSGA